MDIYRDDFDREHFLSLIRDATSLQGIEVHAFCLMGNHFHLLIHSPKANLDRAMHRALSIYARKFNEKHGRDGPLFKSRYHSCLITDESYLLAATRYIHRNPLGLGYSDLAGYRWSSFGMFTGRRRRTSWVDLNFTIALMGGRKAYTTFVEGPFETQVERQLGATKPPTVLGPPLDERSLFVPGTAA